MNIGIFPKGARVVFAGDSITNGNKYVCHIAEYYKNNLADREVQFFNCGISGCSLGTLIAVFDRDIMYYEPTHIVLTIGVNDSGISNQRSQLCGVFGCRTRRNAWTQYQCCRNGSHIG